MLIFKFISSFFLGGILIAIQSILAERYSKYGGYIISLPSTLPLSLFFIGWINGVDDAIQANFAVPFSIINLIIFSFIFYLALSNKKANILFANLLSLLVWFVNSIIISYAFDSIELKFSLFTCLIFILISLVFFNRYIGNDVDNKKSNKESNLKIGLTQRMIIAGAVITIASLLSYFLSPFWGGVFAVFPAAYISSFNFIFLSKGFSNIKRVILRVPEGCLFFLIFSFSFWIIESGNIFIRIIMSYFFTAIIGIMIIYAIRKLYT